MIDIKGMENCDVDVFDYVGFNGYFILLCLVMFYFLNNFKI